MLEIARASCAERVFSKYCYSAAETVVEGSMTNNGNDTFNVIATLRLRKGGKGNMIVTGVLDHTEFPPTFEGSFFSPSKLTQGIVLGKILPHARHVGITIRESARKGTRR